MSRSLHVSEMSALLSLISRLMLELLGVVDVLPLASGAFAEVAALQHSTRCWEASFPRFIHKTRHSIAENFDYAGSYSLSPGIAYLR